MEKKPLIHAEKRRQAVKRKLHQRISELERRLIHAEKYRQVVADVIGTREDGSCYDLDGGELEALLTSAGILEEFEAVEPCAESCICAEEGFPVTCYRLTAAGKAARDE